MEHIAYIMRDTKYRLDHVYTTYYTCLVMHILTGQHFITSNFLIIIDCPEKKNIISPNFLSSYMNQQMQNHLSRCRMI